MDVEYRYDWKLIACVDDHWGIGRQGQLLVDIPADKKAFKAHTIGKIVVGGRKTMEGLPGARALPDRTNIVLRMRRIVLKVRRYYIACRNSNSM